MMKPNRWMMALAAALLGLAIPRPSRAAEQPVAIFHAFHQAFSKVEEFVCALGEQGYSHVQVAPAQKSSDEGDKWYFRYQPVEYGTIEGPAPVPGGAREGEAQLASLINTAHHCPKKMKVIADVVFNHMTSDADFAGLDKFKEFGRDDFHPHVNIRGEDYRDGDNSKEIEGWLGGLPDLKQENGKVRDVHKRHLRKLLDLGIDGFRFDAAKHMEARFVDEYIDYIDAQSGGTAWNYLEVISSPDVPLYFYNWVAAVTDFQLYDTLTDAFKASGSLKSLRVASAFPDSRSVTFGSNHDTRRHIGEHESTEPINPCDGLDVNDCLLAATYVLARESGTPLILNEDNLVPYVKAGVTFRRVMHDRAREGKQTHEYVLAVADSDTLLIMERGPEGFYVVNKADRPYDTPVLDMTLTNLEGCYRELRNNFTVAIERRDNGKKYVTRWGAGGRGGLQIEPREALYFVRDPISLCR